MLGAQDAYALMGLAVERDARVVFVGDTRQLSAVAAGHPFKSLQQAGMATANLTESLRQRQRDLQAAVDLVAAGKVATGLARLDAAGRIVADSDKSKLVERVVSDFVALSPQEREQTLVLAGTHAERRAITQGIRAALAREGRLGPPVEAAALRSPDLTEVQTRFAHQYRVGDVVVPLRHYRRRGLSRTERYAVEAVQGDALLLVGTDGSRAWHEPMGFRKSVYRPQSMAVAVGDRLKWTRNDRERGRRNGQEFRVVAIRARVAEIDYGDGRRERVDLGCAQHWDYAWVSTTYSSQGKTARRVLAFADAFVSQESFYVGVSRVKDDLRLYTRDREHLLERAQVSSANENPLELVRLQARRQQVAASTGDRQPTRVRDLLHPDRHLKALLPSIRNPQFLVRKPGVTVRSLPGKQRCSGYGKCLWRRWPSSWVWSATATTSTSGAGLGACSVSTGRCSTTTSPSKAEVGRSTWWCTCAAAVLSRRCSGWADSASSRSQIVAVPVSQKQPNPVQPFQPPRTR